MIGYALHVAGAIAEIFGIPISLVLLIPGGLFELALAFWLLIKVFSPRSMPGVSSPRPTALTRRSVTRRCSGSDDSDRSPSPRQAVAEGETRGTHPSASRGSPGFSI